MTNVFGRAQQTNAANRKLLRSLRHVAAARVRIAPPQRVQQRLKTQLVGPQLVPVGLYVVLFNEAAHRYHVGHTGHLAQSAFDHPVFQGAQFGGGFAIALQAVAHDFTHGRGVGRDIRFHASGQVHAAQTFVDLLAHQIDFGFVVIGDDGERQTKLGVREQANRIGQSRQGHLDRQGDLLFHLFGGAAGVQGNHSDLGVGHIGEGFNGQVLERKDTGHGEQHRAQHDKQGLVQRVMNQLLHWTPAGCTEDALCAAAALAASSAMRNSRANSKPFSLTTTSAVLKPLVTKDSLAPS